MREKTETSCLRNRNAVEVMARSVASLISTCVCACVCVCVCGCARVHFVGIVCVVGVCAWMGGS